MTIQTNTHREEIGEFEAFLAKGEPPHQYEKYWVGEQSDRVKAILKGENPPPEELEIQSSPYCNANCLHCFGRKLRQLESKLEKKENINRVIGEVIGFEKNGFKIDNVKFCGSTGEPLMNQQTLYMIDEFSKYRNVILFSNGIKIGENKDNINYMDTLSKCKKIVVSLDAGTNNVLYSIKPGAKKRKVNIDDIFEGIKNITDNGIRIDLGYVVTTRNYWDLPVAAIKSKEAGVNSIKVRVDMLDKEIREKHYVIKKTIENAKKDNDENFQVSAIHSDKEIKDTDENAFSPEARKVKCFTSTFWACIGSNGNMYPCGHVVDRESPNYGNILEQSFKDIWEGEKRMKVIEKLPGEKCNICSPASMRRNEFLTFLSTISDPIRLIDMHNNIYSKAKKSKPLESVVRI